MSVRFYQEIPITLKNRKGLKAFILYIFQKEKRPVDSLRIIFCPDAYLLKINKEFLKHNDFTDVITFELSEDLSTTSGEIYISVDRVKENATILNLSFTSEIHRVIFHGVLHLCGYNDKSALDISQIRKKEDYYLTRYFSAD